MELGGSGLIVLTSLTPPASYNHLAPTTPLPLPHPPQVGLLTDFTGYMDFKSNRLSGVLPSQIGGMTKMNNYFDLQGNQFTGQIPEELFGE